VFLDLYICAVDNFFIIVTCIILFFFVLFLFVCRCKSYFFV
jgi:hypothetical protein